MGIGTFVPMHTHIRKEICLEKFESQFCQVFTQTCIPQAPAFGGFGAPSGAGFGAFGQTSAGGFGAASAPAFGGKLLCFCLNLWFMWDMQPSAAGIQHQELRLGKFVFGVKYV